VRVDQKERVLARIKAAINEMAGIILNTSLDYTRIKNEFKNGSAPVLTEGNRLIHELYLADVAGNLWDLLEGSQWDLFDRKRREYKGALDMLLSLDEPDNPFHLLEQLSPKTATAVTIFTCSRYCVEMLSYIASWAVEKEIVKTVVKQSEEKELFSFFDKPLPLPADAELIEILTEVLTIQRLVAKVHLSVSVHNTVIMVTAPYIKEKAIGVKNRTLGKEKKRDDKWKKIEKILCQFGNEIYSPGYTLNEVAKGLIRKWECIYTEPAPDSLTIKRYLEKYSDIKAKNISQISDLISKLRPDYQN